MICVFLPPPWLKTEDSDARPIQVIDPSQDEIQDYNVRGYNVYFYPNYPQNPRPTGFLTAREIDTFEWVFVDLDMKHGAYESKEVFITLLQQNPCPPTKIVDSGNGIHAYWRVEGLDAMSFLRLARRLMRFYNTDEAVVQLKQLMRLPFTVNTKDPENLKLCQLVSESTVVYTIETLDKHYPPIRTEDEDYCKRHYDTANGIIDTTTTVDHTIPPKFYQLIKSSKEAKDIWFGNTSDRSASDYRLGHLMFAAGFTKEEAISVLLNSHKASERSPAHQLRYADGIVNKIWIYETEPTTTLPALSQSVKEILSKGEAVLKGTRLPCDRLVDDTVHGFRLGQVLGLVAGSGVGKTTFSINMFMWFTRLNPEYDHFFVALEQPANEIADRWRTICGTDTTLHDKVHVLSNYGEDGTFRHLSLDEIKEYILLWQKEHGRKVGTIIIDHIGALKKQAKNGENQALVDICHKMKGFAIETNTFVIMQSQAPREKAGIGDLELNKDAAYGTVFFESYVDYLVTLWQPLKRCYAEGAPTIMAFKFCKIRHKKQHLDRILEDVCYRVMFDPKTELLSELTQEDDKAMTYWVTRCTTLRRADRKTDVVQYQSRRLDGNTDNNKDPRTVN